VFYFSNSIKLILLNLLNDGPQISENWPRTIRATVPPLIIFIHVSDWISKVYSKFPSIIILYLRLKPPHKINPDLGSNAKLTYAKLNFIYSVQWPVCDIRGRIDNSVAGVLLYNFRI
jgi:hypothetical protein